MGIGDGGLIGTMFHPPVTSRRVMLKLPTGSCACIFNGRLRASSDTHSAMPRPGDDRSDATIVGDLTTGEGIPQDAFDCFICTQTLQFIAPAAQAVDGIRNLLAPDGVVLATVPGISQISRVDDAAWGDFWRFTARGARHMFDPVFGTANVDVAVLFAPPAGHSVRKPARALPGHPCG